jgi:membrane protein implicated in regulation of membrane protease activity
MTILIVLLVLALIFGVGSVLEGLAWGFVIVLALLVAAAVYGYKTLAERPGKPVSSLKPSPGRHLLLAAGTIIR